MNFSSKSKAFQDLSVTELYAILRLRSEIFVVEQQCVYLDADNKDQAAHHILLYQGEELVAYARIVPAGLSFPEVSIGRIITSQTVRGTGAGKILVQLAIDECHRLNGKQTIRIGAQLYAKAFYERLGFEATGEIYDEDGIDHIEMTL